MSEEGTAVMDEAWEARVTEEYDKWLDNFVYEMHVSGIIGYTTAQVLKQTLEETYGTPHEDKVMNIIWDI